MKLSRDNWLAIGLVILLTLLTLAAALRKNNTPAIPYLSSSSAPDGTLALGMWVQKLGIRLLENSSSVYQPPADANIIFIIQPIYDISNNEFDQLDGWVRSGGTLILAGDTPYVSSALKRYDFSLSYLNTAADGLPAQTPLLTSPELTTPAPVKPALYLDSTRSDFVTLLASDGHPLIVSFDQGSGRVILSSVVYPFSNLGLKDDANASLVLNLVALAKSRGSAWFDDWHHGLQTNTAIIGPEQWLRATPIGHSLLFAAGIVFIALLLAGRGFGRPVPLPHELKRRGPLEHVTAIANLNRKAGHRSAALEQYRTRLKRQLGRRYRLDPSLPDAEYVDALKQYNPSLDRTALLNLLKGLSRKDVNEIEMVELASDASEWMKD